DGVCGSANGGTFSSTPTTGLCDVGTPTQVTVDGDSFIWQCQGANTANDPGCMATKSSGSTSSSSSGACTDPGSTSTGDQEATPVAGMVLTFDDEFNTLSA